MLVHIVMQNMGKLPQSIHCLNMSRQNVQSNVYNINVILEYQFKIDFCLKKNR